MVSRHKDDLTSRHTDPTHIHFLESSYLATAHNIQTQMFLDHTLPLGPCVYSSFNFRSDSPPTSCAHSWDAFWAMPARDMISFQISNGFRFTASFLICTKLSILMKC